MSQTVAVLVFFSLLLVFPLALIFCTVVARDMDSRGQDGRIYGVLTFLALPLGIVVWLVQRRRFAVVPPPAKAR